MNKFIKGILNKMKKFYYFLQDQPQYANKILANSKNEVKSLLMENLSDESSILKILSEEEMVAKSNPNNNAIYAEAEDYKSGNDFMNDMIKSATKVATTKSNNTSVIKPEQEVVNQPQNNIVNKQSQPKYFEEAGIQFKLENGKLYKKIWKDANDNEINFRIINLKTNKEVDKSKFKLEKLDWVEI